MDNARVTWNERYRNRETHDDLVASQWLTENETLIAERAGGRALDLACGTGRNALYLARLGFVVDALDISDVAIERLTTVAGRGGAEVRARVVDLEHEADSLPAERYAVVVLTNYLQRDLFAEIARTLAPGGIVVAETVTRVHTEQLGRPFDPRFVLEPGELAAAFTGLRVLRSQEAVVQRGGRPRAVASIVAERPG